MAIAAISGVASTAAVRAVRPEAEAHTPDPRPREQAHEQAHVDDTEKAAEIEPVPDGEHHIHVVA